MATVPSQQNTTKIMVFGTFDMLHPGHESFFAQARNLAKEGTVPYLIVSVARDSNVHRIKGKYPGLSEGERVRRLSNHYLVDRVVLGGESDYLRHIVLEAPDVIALGYDQVAYVDSLKRDLKELSNSKGGEVEIVRLQPHFSQYFKTSILKK